ncbi:MAG TPA: hypothetical protein VGO67_09690 [Verrucomicrobiae bacterium]|jgi:hypothetical protein
MKKRAFCFASLTLVVLALYGRLEGLTLQGKAMKLHLRGLVAKTDPEHLREETSVILKKSQLFDIIGLCLAVASLTCLILSFRRKEQTSLRFVPICLLALYVIMFFAIV